MSAYSAPLRLTKIDRGHRADCAFVDNFGPVCGCDSTRDERTGKKAIQVQRNAMLSTGWTVNGPQAFGRSIGPFIVTVARVAAGWQYRLEKLLGLTVFEEGSFGNLKTCLEDLWQNIMYVMDQYLGTSVELARLRALDRDTDLDEARAGWEANLPAHKSLPCPSCGVSWEVSVDVARLRCIRCHPLTSIEKERMAIQDMARPRCMDCVGEMLTSRSTANRVIWYCPSCDCEWYVGQFGLLCRVDG